MLDDAFAPELLTLVADLASSFSPEPSARLRHFAEVQRLDRNGRRSSAGTDSLEAPYVVAVFTPEPDPSGAPLLPETDQLSRLASRLLSSAGGRWSNSGISFHNSKSELTFFEDGRTMLVTQQPFIDDNSFLASDILEAQLVGLAIAAERHPSAPEGGYAHLTLRGANEVAFGNGDRLTGSSFSTDDVTVGAPLEFSRSARADAAIFPLIQKVWRAAGLRDTPNFSRDNAWDHWDTNFRWAEG